MTDPTPDVFANLLNSGTAKRVTVSLYGDQEGLHELAGLYDEAERINAAIESASKAPGQRAAGEKSQARVLEAEAAALQARIDECEARVEPSISKWTVRALTRAELRDISVEYREPLAPVMPPKSAPKAVKEAWEADRDAWLVQATALGEARVLAEIATAVVSVETATGVLDAVTIDQLRALLDAEYGDDNITALSNAVKSASKSERDVSRPFSRINSPTSPA